MSCEAPKPQWSDGFRVPANAAVCVSGFVCLVVGVGVANWPAGLLPYVGSVLVFAGSTRAALAALGFGSAFEFLRGGRVRLQSLTEECQGQLAKMEYLVERVCRNRTAVRQVITVATTTVCRTWTRGTGTAFQFYLFCHAILFVRTPTKASGVPPWEPEIELEAIVVLHRVCGFPTSEIAHMLDRDVDTVREQIKTAPARGEQS